MQPAPHDVPALVERWQGAGIITAEQAQRIRADLATLGGSRRSFVAEGLGYLGGVVVLVGLGYLLSLSWQDLSEIGKLSIFAGTSVGLVVAGAVIPTASLGATGKRLRGVLWALATVGIFLSLGTLLGDVLSWSTEGNEVITVASAGTGAAAAGLWALNRHVLQHVATVWPTMVAANTSVGLVTDDWFLASLAVWLVGVVWFLLSLRDIIPQRSGGVLGSAGATIGGLMMLGEPEGPLMALGTVVALVVSAVVRRDLGVLAVGSVGTLIALPFFIERYLPGQAFATAIALVAAGLALVATAVYTARRRREDPPAAPAT